MEKDNLSDECFEQTLIHRKDIIPDNVNSPAHYNQGKIECIEFIEDQNMGFHLGNAVKYITRAGKKNPDKLQEDLDKALWYIRRYVEIEMAKKENREPLRPNDMNK